MFKFFGRNIRWLSYHFIANLCQMSQKFFFTDAKLSFFNTKQLKLISSTCYNFLENLILFSFNFSYFPIRWNNRQSVRVNRPRLQFKLLTRIDRKKKIDTASMVQCLWRFFLLIQKKQKKKKLKQKLQMQWCWQRKRVVDDKFSSFRQWRLKLAMTFSNRRYDGELATAD